ncbi:methyl-accepting chemotaxis protein [Phenylobacterium sp.]|uniref:methyl-accepting chemotaxis protein n=1 Tax=Phenylobacterium sp. TaxID=1871053 RepID=UPI0027170613|nr:HAMP domain-containing methyl-accepting chemotaxis protein [Phenylobacterium sp.]MDO8800620.1 HAMP domain-containing methyl-accepting chemotaxis protein [Phenylobacterium sp.]
MGFISNLRLSAKIMLIVAMLLSLTAGMTAFAVIKANGMAAATKHLIEDPVKGNALAARAEGAFTRMHQIAYETVVETDDGQLPELQKEFDAQVAEVRAALKDMKPLIEDEHVAPFKVMTDSLETYVALNKELQEQRMIHLLFDCESTLQDKMTPVYDQADAAITLLNRQQQKDIDQSAVDAAKDSQAVFWWLVGVGGTGALLLGALSIYISRKEIAGPIAGMTQAMENLAGGDLTIHVSGKERRDEIGAMARAVQVFKENGLALTTAEAEKVRMEAQSAQERQRAEAERAALAAEQAHVVESVAEGLSRLSDGDLLHRLPDDFPVAYIKLRDDFNRAIGGLEEAMLVIAANASSMQNGAGEISNAADDLSRRTEQQAASLEETAAALDEITVTVKKSAAGAEQANDVVNAARGDAERSGVVVNEAVDAMGEIASSSRQISQIIGVIDEIAFQTNLLALNAGVEAARAGDAGRGFAVVASEVRALAQRSAEAAKEIKTLIAASTRQVESGVRLVGETGTALAGIVNKVSEISGLVSEIAASSQEQATGLNQVNAAVNQMDQVTQQNAAMVEQSTAASHSLSQEAQELNRLVARFKTSGGHAAPQAARRQAPAHAPRPQMRATSQVAQRPADDSWEEF